MFQGKYYDEDTEWAYRKRKTVTPYNQEDVYEVDKAYEIKYTLGTHDEKGNVIDDETPAENIDEENPVEEETPENAEGADGES